MGDETNIYRIPYLTDEDLVEDTPNVDKEQAERIDYLFSVNTGPEGPEGPPGPPRDSMYGDLQPADPDDGGSGEIVYVEKNEDVRLYWNRSDPYYYKGEVIGPVEIETNGRPIIVEFDAQGAQLSNNSMEFMTSTGEHTFKRRSPGSEADQYGEQYWTFTKPGWNFLYVHSQTFIEDVFVYGGGGGGGAGIAGNGVERHGGGGAAGSEVHVWDHYIEPGMYHIYVGRGGKGGTEENPDGEPGQASFYLIEEMNDYLPFHGKAEGGGGGTGATVYYTGAPNEHGHGGSNAQYTGGEGGYYGVGGGAGTGSNGNPFHIGTPGRSRYRQNVVDEGDDWPSTGAPNYLELIGRGGCGGAYDTDQLSNLSNYSYYLPTRAADGGDGGDARGADGWVNGEDGKSGMVQIRVRGGSFAPPWTDWSQNRGADVSWMDIQLKIDDGEPERISRLECLPTVGEVTLPANCKRRLELPAGKHKLEIVAEVVSYNCFLFGSDGKPLSMRVYYA